MISDLFRRLRIIFSAPRRWSRRPRPTEEGEPTLLTVRITVPAATETAPTPHLHGCHCIDCTRRLEALAARLRDGTASRRDRMAYVSAMRKNFGPRMRRRVFRRDGHRCVFCLGWGSATHRKLTLDHVIPLARGGTNEESNLVTSCERCNTVKGARMPDDPNWLAFLTHARHNRR